MRRRELQGRGRRRRLLAIMAIVPLVVAALVSTAGAGHPPGQGNPGHCPDHRDAPKDDSPDPGGANSLEVDGATVWLHYSDDLETVEFHADEEGTEPLAVDFCVKASNRNSGEHTGTSFTVDWTNRGGQTPQISYVVVYGVADGDPCEGAGGDTDGDGVCDDEDNCPEVANAGQEDSDGDGIGDACDTEGPPGDPSCSDGDDNDGDGLVDGDDPDCQSDPCEGAGGDTDGDGVCDDEDNCPEVANAGQEDSDGDGIGDACDTEGPPGDPSCSDGDDNDGDGLVDGDDPDCQQAPPDELTCRANLLAVALAGNPLPNLFEANPPSKPCVAEQDGLLVALAPVLGDGGLGLLNEENQIELTDPTGTQPGFIIVDALWADTATDGTTASADSGVLLLHVNDGSEDRIVVEVLTSESQTSCDSGTTTSAEVVRVFIGGEEVRIPGEHTVLVHPALFEVIELHLEDAGEDGTDEGPDASGAQAADLAALAGNLTAAVADSETGCE